MSNLMDYAKQASAMSAVIEGLLIRMPLVDADAVLDDVRRLVWMFGQNGEPIDLDDGSFKRNPAQGEIVALLAGLPVAAVELAIISARINLWEIALGRRAPDPETAFLVTGGPTGGNARAPGGRLN